MNHRQIPPFAAIRAFEAVGRCNGFRRAAALLNISHAIVSRHVTSLEQHLGVALIDRRTGELTSVGKEYHTRISAAITELETATFAARVVKRTQLTVWCSAGFALLWLTRRMSGFSARSDGVLIDLHSTDTQPNLILGEADADIRYQPDQPASTRPSEERMLELARPAVYPVASPKLLASLSFPIENARDLLRCPLIEESNGSEWTNWFAAQQITPPLDASPVARYGQAHLALAAARSEQGIALGNDFLAADDIAEGRLVRIRPTVSQFNETSLGAYVFRAAKTGWHDPALIRFRSWLKAEFAR